MELAFLRRLVKQRKYMLTYQLSYEMLYRLEEYLDLAGRYAVAGLCQRMICAETQLCPIERPDPSCKQVPRMTAS